MKLFVMILFSMTLNSWADSRVGNGGDGVEINNHVYLFDLFENYVHINPVLEAIEPDQKELLVIENHLISIKGQVQENFKAGSTDYTFNELVYELTKKLTAISGKDQLLGYSLYRAVSSFNWSLAPIDLTDVKDDDGTDIKNPHPLLQIAVRSHRSIRMNNRLIIKMDLANVVATMVHEIVYGMIRPIYVTEQKMVPVKVTHPDGTIEEYEKAETSNYFVQPSRRVREIVAFLFSREISKTSLTSILAIVDGSLPINNFNTKLFFGKTTNRVLYDFKFNPGDYFDFRSETQLDKALAAKCKSVSRSASNEIIFISYRGFNWRFNYYTGKNYSRNSYFAQMIDNAHVTLGFRYTEGANTEQCILKGKAKLKSMLKDFIY